ncbi:MAG: GAF domain-containing SpoIIE family protein phosphatase [Isosphaeraceae bacterium]
MQPPPIPDNEAERLASLYALRLLDTLPEDRFDRVTRLATRLFEVPVAYVALVDADRQWFKSKQGLPVVSTGRDISFCGHAILGTDTLIVPDTREDARFWDNPQVTGEPGLRFYAGQPLVGPNGQNVGTFCIGDTKPRTLSEAEHKTFRDLASLVEREVNLVDVVQSQGELLKAREQTAKALNQALKSRERLARELAVAARYVRSLLPSRLGGPVVADWHYQPSSELGGDAFGYRWLDDDRFALYLLDVSGHGVGSALLSVSVLEALRGGPFSEADFANPAEVLSYLNRSFRMDDHAYLFFTLWYGVWDRSTRRLDFATAGHPPALLFRPDGCNKRLGQPMPAIGIDPESHYETESIDAPIGSRLYVYSDGAFEIDRADGGMGNLNDWFDYLAQHGANGYDPEFPARAYENARARRGRKALADDFAVVQFQLG